MISWTRDASNRFAVIISLVDDAAWQDWLSRVPPWQPPTMPTLVVAPHPDDETLGAGALIATLSANGVPVSVVAVTDGENCYDVSPDRRKAVRHTREHEQVAALAKLGVPRECVHRLRLTDSGLHLQEAELTSALMRLAEPGMHLVAPWIGDFHPDHEACARAAANVAREKSLPLTSYFFWTWHRGVLSTVNPLPLVRFQPSSAALRAKAEALKCHISQLQRADSEPILPERLLGPARWPFEVFLPA